MASRKENPKRKQLYIHANEASKKVARAALRKRKDVPPSKRGGLDAVQAHEAGVGSGVMRARDIAAGKRVNAYQVKAFFDRHRGNYLKAKADGKRWEDSKALQAWDLWGGEPFRKQVEAAIRKHERALAKENPMPSKSRRARSRRSSAYTVYLVREHPGKLEIFNFKSDELVCPSASASEYAWIMGESALENRSTHIFTDEKKLRKFLSGNRKRIVRGIPRYPNPRNSKVKDALASEATRYTEFKDFSEAYWNACSRGTYWYATNEKKFHIGLPERKLISSGKFFVHCSPTLALEGALNENKKYVAELDVTNLPAGSISVKRGSSGSSIKITGSPAAVKVSRVLETDKAKRSFKWQLSILPSSKEELRDVWEKAWEKRKKEAEKKAAAKERKLERELKRQESRISEEKRAKARAARESEKKKAQEKKKRISKSEAAKERKAAKERIRSSGGAPKKKRVRRVRVKP